MGQTKYRSRGSRRALSDYICKFKYHYEGVISPLNQVCLSFCSLLQLQYSDCVIRKSNSELPKLWSIKHIQRAGGLKLVGKIRRRDISFEEACLWSWGMNDACPQGNWTFLLANAVFIVSVFLLRIPLWQTAARIITKMGARTKYWPVGWRQ